MMIIETTKEHLLCAIIVVVHLHVFSVVTRTAQSVSALREFTVLCKKAISKQGITR